MIEVAALITCAAWVFLLLGRDGFWLASCRDDEREPLRCAARNWPSVTAVIPARDEAQTVGETVSSLLSQDYPGALEIIVVDDGSRDGTVAAALAAASGARRTLKIIAGEALPPGWTGKVFALKQGVTAASLSAPDYLLFTDADIAHDPHSVARLVCRAERGGLTLVSLMVLLTRVSPAERAMHPAFVYFFQMLYPFPAVALADRRLAAAAGGCVLVRRDALAQAGGLEAIRCELIDDCALARRLKRVGPIWLGLTRNVRSLRRYDTFAELGQMVTRSAYAQLRYSTALLCATVLAMTLVFLTGPALAIFAAGLSQWLGAAAWLAMAVSFQPTLRLYRLNPLWGAALPAIAGWYTLLTIRSAIEWRRGRGGRWKDRFANKEWARS